MSHHRSHPATPSPQGERLQKVLAAAGLGSRRHCEELISAGRVEVEGLVITELGTRVDPATQQIHVDSEPLKNPQRLYFMVHKPQGVISTNRDPSRRLRVVDLIPSEQRLFTVGRLDRTSEGLMVVTNDGDLANRLAHPRFGVEKTYLVQVMGAPEPHVLRQLRQGIHLSEGRVQAGSVRVKRRRQNVTDLEIVLREGRNREIRRMLARVGHKVLRLKRVALGPLRLGDLPAGASRPLTPAELRQLQQTARGQRRRDDKAGQGGQSEAARRPQRSTGRPRRAGKAPRGWSTGGKAASGTVLTYDSAVASPGSARNKPPRKKPRRKR